MSPKIFAKAILLASLAFIFSCERYYNNPWDGKASLDPDSWAPQNLAIEDVSITEKKLTWTYTGDNRFEGFKLDRKAGNAEWQEDYQVLPKEALNWTDSQIIPDPSLTYSYRVYAFAGKYSSMDITATVSGAISAPSNLLVTPVSINAVTLSWDDNCNGEDGYKIDRKVNSGEWELIYASVGSNLTSYLDNNIDWQANDYTYRIYAYSAQYNSSNVESTISWPEVSTTTVSNITYNAAICGGSISIEGYYAIIERGVCYGTTPNPDLTGTHTTDGSGTGSFSANISGLNSTTTYYVRAYATTNYGTAYGIQKSFMTVPKIGDTYAGGIVFYLNGKGGGLVCAPSDQSNGAQWGCYGTTIGGTTIAIGAGSSNTAKIVAGCNTAGIAARICNDLVLNGYSDWFLPSKDELNLMYQNLKVAGIGGFASVWYWSSSEDDNHDAWMQFFDDGNQYGNYKGSNLYVRAVRAY